MTDVGTVIDRGNVAVIAGGATLNKSLDMPIDVSINEVPTSGVENGVPVADVAADVVAAVDGRQVWILTHEDLRSAPVERMQRASTQTNLEMPAPASFNPAPSNRVQG